MITMYYPYFRGKQYDLITIRENADLLAQSNFIPIVEPVKETLSGLTRTLDAVSTAQGKLILIVNPENGDHVGNSDAIHSLFQNELKDHSNISVGILLTEEIKVEKVEELSNSFENRPITLIHAGFSDGRLLSESIKINSLNPHHVFFEEYCGKLYRKHFRNQHRVLLRDGFQRRANRLHPAVEFFSDIHATFPEEGMNGFGDFLIVGDEYSETGGPAYAVAIHLTFIDPHKDDGMYLHHFKSIRHDTPTDPAGKFAEALDKLVAELNQTETHLLRTKAVEEFVELHKRGHFPGLGYVKKLSMQHHIETLAHYFLQQNQQNALLS